MVLLKKKKAKQKKKRKKEEQGENEMGDAGKDNTKEKNIYPEQS